MENAFNRAMQKEDIDALWDMYHPRNSIAAVGQSNNGRPTNLKNKIDKGSVETLALYTVYLLDAQTRAQKTLGSL